MTEKHSALILTHILKSVEIYRNEQIPRILEKVPTQLSTCYCTVDLEEFRIIVVTSAFYRDTRNTAALSDSRYDKYVRVAIYFFDV